MSCSGYKCRGLGVWRVPLHKGSGVLGLEEQQVEEMVVAQPQVLLGIQV